MCFYVCSYMTKTRQEVNRLVGLGNNLRRSHFDANAIHMHPIIYLPKILKIKCMVITFRKGVAHAQDRHQVIHIAVDALCDSRVLQKPRVGYTGLREHYTVAVHFVNQNKFKPVRVSGGRTHGPLTTNTTQNTSSKTALTLLSTYWWASLFQNISKLFVLLKKVERRDIQI